jgi:hypothetical protein
MLHFLQFFFAPEGKPWFEGAVWGNVIAVLPLAILAALGWLWHKSAVSELHRKLNALAARHDEHAERLKRLLDAVDPDMEAKLDEIKNSVDPDTPVGLTAWLRTQLKGNS